MANARTIRTHIPTGPARGPIRRTAGALAWALLIAAGAWPGPQRASAAGPLRAGAAKVDVTDVDAGPVNDTLYVKALVLRDDATTAVVITVDAVAIGEIGPIRNDYLGKVRARLREELGIGPESVMVNASHCHGIVRADVADRTVEAVRQAVAAMVPVRVGAGVGREDQIMENRRLRMKDGREVDVRHAYALPPDEEVAAVGPVDPEIGILRLDAHDGRTVAVVYNFACHPIQGVPSGGNTADLTGFASRAIEENLSEGAVALFVQGCGGDINPARYKDVDAPRDAETLGNLLGLSTLRALRTIRADRDGPLEFVRETIDLPRADTAARIAELEAEQQRLLLTLTGTSLNLKSFLALAAKYNASDEFPSYASHGYLSERQRGRGHLARLDAENRANMRQYIANVHTMERLTRLQTNLALLRKHHAENAAAGSKTVEVDLLGLRVGDFRLVTSPGELTVQIGLNIKAASPHDLTFVAGYTNGYIYYAPTAEQLRNVGGAQEDSDCILAPEWQALFESRAGDLLRRL